MRPGGRLAPIVGCVAGLLLHAEGALAQQGSVQISSAVQTLRGDPSRFAGQNEFEPDLGVSWLQPGSRFGVFQIEIRGARRGDSLHTGRIYGALREAKYHGAAWTIEAGDAYFTPRIVGYGFSNLFSPAVTFNGAAIRARTERTTVAVVAGRTTAWRNIFGNDPKGLGQTVAIGNIARRLGSRFELSAHGSRVRTTSLDEFSYTIDASDQAGGGARVLLTPSVQFVADGSIVSYRRTGTSSRERDGSYITGLNWLHSRGWIRDAVLILDGGVRSEQARKGRYRFDAVRSGAHTVKLLIESLPDGAVIAGEPEVRATLSRDALVADITFVVSVDKRPEIRKVFPPRGGANVANPTTTPRGGPGRGARTATPSTPRNTGASTPVPQIASTPATPIVPNVGGKFTVQIAALNDPLRAKDAVRQLKESGLPAYLLNPPASDPNAPYRVRVGPYDSREEAQKTAQSLEAQRHEKLWVTREKYR